MNKDQALIYQAGMSGKQELPEKFRVTQSNTADAPQDIYINREIHTGMLSLEGKVCPSLTSPFSLNFPI